MSVRTRRVGAISVYAATPGELAAIADAYARGERPRPHGHDASLFRRAAADLRSGDCPAVDLGAARFYCDRPDGTPFHAPYAPDPDPDWAARRAMAAPPAGA
jgi:hypothetical protein